MAFPKKWIPVIYLLTITTMVWLFWNITSKITAQLVREPYTKTLVIPRTKDEDVTWIDEHFGGDPHITQSIYIADDPLAELHPPQNKGNEVMTYLSYIIDHYHNLSDISIFMHSHRYSWHNNDLLENDAVEMISRLSGERVQREGFMNMRCHWEPGCPAWIHPGTIKEDIQKPEETMIAKSWTEIFPLNPIPNILAQPCCGQFAISRDRIQGIPLTTFIFYRDWLLSTPLPDYISGRIWEYLWQFVFTGKNIVCPRESVCYCDGFGVYFGGEEKYNAYCQIEYKKRRLEEELENWTRRNDSTRKDWDLKEDIKRLKKLREDMRLDAKRHGDIAKNRAEEVRMEWKEGAVGNLL